jgi:hypothetical protein
LMSTAFWVAAWIMRRASGSCRVLRVVDMRGGLRGMGWK